MQDPRIDVFNIDFHREKYGPDNHGESFEQQRQEETALLKLAYWLQDTSFVSQNAKTIAVSAMLVYLADKRFSAALASRLTGVINSMLYRSTV